MHFEITGVLGFIITAIISLAALVLVVLGAFQVLNIIIIDFLLDKTFRYLGVYKRIVEFCYYYTDFKLYMKKRDLLDLPTNKPMYEEEE